MLLAELVEKSLLQPVNEFEPLVRRSLQAAATIREHAYHLLSQGDDLIDFRAWCSTYVSGLEGTWSITGPGWAVRGGACQLR